ncbi:MAG TPA: pit accessory protein [Verrucomicrobiales bacterium]|nr:pit accessory protein [Verrucomicrobiales bacterium]
MLALQNLFGKKDVFYDLLEASATQARKSVQSLHSLLSAPVGDGATLEAFAASRREDKKITEQIDEALCRTFVTELEREDISALATALYKIPKTVEKIAERVMIARQHLEGADFSRQITLMDSAADCVVTMITELRSKLHLERVKVLNDKLQKIEGDADKLVLECLRDLYSQTSRGAITIIVMRDLYDLMEKVVDRCRDAGKVVAHIVLKNS